MIKSNREYTNFVSIYEYGEFVYLRLIRIFVITP